MNQEETEQIEELMLQIRLLSLEQQCSIVDEISSRIEKATVPEWRIKLDKANQRAVSKEIKRETRRDMELLITVFASSVEFRLNNALFADTRQFKQESTKKQRKSEKAMTLYHRKVCRLRESN